MATFSDSKIAANSCSPKYSMCLPICFTHYSFKTFTQMQSQQNDSGVADSDREAYVAPNSGLLETALHRK